MYVTAETNRATLVENLLAASLTQLNATLQAAISVVNTSLWFEVVRATNAESIINSNLNNEVNTRATTVTNEINARTTAVNTLNSSFTFAVSSEIARATAAESMINTNINSVNGSLITTVSNLGTSKNVVFDNTTMCNATNKGLLRFTSNSLQVCNTSAWLVRFL